MQIMSKILIKNIKELVQVETELKIKVIGTEMAKLQSIKDAFNEHNMKYELYAKHLYFDREEVTVHARLLSPIPVKESK